MNSEKKFLYISLSILFLLIILCIFFTEKKSQSTPATAAYTTSCGTYASGDVAVDGKDISVDIADTECKKALGLSGRKTLTDGQGMIFLFNTLGNYGFWMKDMNFPLDIIWIDNEFQITGIEKNLATSTYDMNMPASSTIFGQNYLAQYVLEVPAGYADENNLKVGDKIIFSEKTL